MYKVTIAIPIYNTQDFIRDSLLSALNQTFKSIEYLLIDDKGNDNSINIVHELIDTHDRGKDIRIVTHEKNMGIAHVRNTALKEAKGDYFFFLDSDDTIKENCIELLYNKMTEHPVDFVAASYQKINEKEQIIESITYPDIIIEGKNKVAEYYYRNFKYVSISITVWNKLYKLSFLREKQIQFIPERINEDDLFTFNLALKAQSCRLLSESLYKYKIRSNSLTQYNSRSIIPIDEIEIHFFTYNYRKSESVKYIKQPFFEHMITQIMMDCFNNMAVIISKKKYISEKISPSKIKNTLNYPISFSEVCVFKYNKILNILLLIFSKLPFWIEVIIMKLYITLLSFYRKIK